MVWAKSFNAKLRLVRALILFEKTKQVFVWNEFKQGQILQLLQENPRLYRERDKPHLHEDEEDQNVQKIPNELKSNVHKDFQDEQTNSDLHHGQSHCLCKLI